MINVKEFVYNELKNNSTISGYIGTRIYPQVAPVTAEYPLIVYNRISSGKIDLKGIRNEYIQVTVWGKTVNTNELIMNAIISLFNGLKKPPVKSCNVQRLDETFDKETGSFGNHTTVHIKMLES